jgi:hypothetical protein
MPKELIDPNFNELLWRLNSIEPVDPPLEVKLRIAFQEEVIRRRTI